MPAKNFVVQLNVAAWMLRSNLEGLTHDDSMAQPRPAGNCINWILGHVVGARDLIAELIGAEGVLDDQTRQRYGRGSEPITDSAPKTFDELLEAFQASHEGLLEGFESISEGSLTAKAPFSPAGNENETIESLLASLMIHESYHIGQVGVVRRVIGRSGVLG
ncbi:MAG: DinB family protein [Holophagales bacterium]|nr:DinB family protein [Holophagales bacterium]